MAKFDSELAFVELVSAISARFFWNFAWILAVVKDMHVVCDILYKVILDTYTAFLTCYLETELFRFTYTNPIFTEASKEQLSKPDLSSFKLIKYTVAWSLLFFDKLHMRGYILPWPLLKCKFTINQWNNYHNAKQNCVIHQKLFFFLVSWCVLQCKEFALCRHVLFFLEQVFYTRPIFWQTWPIFWQSVDRHNWLYLDLYILAYLKVMPIQNFENSLRDGM